MTDLSLREAFDESIRKWELLSEHGRKEEYGKIPCGLCEYQESLGNYGCNGCPLMYADGTICAGEGHVWKIWSVSSTKENAKAVLDLIKRKEQEVFGMETKFKVGDTVEALSTVPFTSLEGGWWGKIVSVKSGNCFYVVGLDEEARVYKLHYKYLKKVDTMWKSKDMLKEEQDDETLRALDESINHWEDNVLQLKRWDRAGKEIKNEKARGRFHPAGYGGSISYAGRACQLCNSNRRGSVNLPDCDKCVLKKYYEECREDSSTWGDVNDSHGNIGIISACERMLTTLLQVREKYLADRKPKEEVKRFGLEGDEKADTVLRLFDHGSGYISLQARKQNPLSYWHNVLSIGQKGYLRRHEDVDPELGLSLGGDGRVVEDFAVEYYGGKRK